ncbi:hypothetical protein FCH28_13625 [Streptomyces piniterrae]|uniref:Lipoprotein n=1 Tax=Streptomyces piniterrae TaxID=2571125 RepID=A0A4U0NIX4_9ACTN|nr:hypothetical protein [Streptomyces piniterrae]TJZ54216.1 hypothetical protein FCH28_13625 [Streptomyces piniterrae]
MTRTTRKLVVGAALFLSCIACTANSGGNTGPSATASSADQFTPINQLKSISLDGDPLSETETSDTREAPRAVGEVHAGHYRMIAYTQGSSCGLLVVDAKRSKRSLINLVSAWPKDRSEGSQRYAAGPYGLASGAGSDASHSQASLYCSEKAMVVEFTSREDTSTAGQQGQVSLKERQSEPAALVMVVGSDDARKKITDHFK